MALSRSLVTKCWVATFFSAVTLRLVWDYPPQKESIVITIIATSLWATFDSWIIFIPFFANNNTLDEEEDENNPKGESLHHDLLPSTSDVPNNSTQVCAIETSSLATEKADQPQNNIPEASINTRSKLLYLDNVKTFLTFLVLLCHVTVVFLGKWYLVVDVAGASSFKQGLQHIVILNNYFFMSLFFFISAYFVPDSFAKRGPSSFRRGKMKRLLLPALFTTFFVNPICIAVGRLCAGANVYYQPLPATAWFLFWLIIFNWVYSSIMGAEETNAESNAAGTESATLAFPSILQRFAWGSILCSFKLIPKMRGIFFLMPLISGSFTCHFFAFYSGIQARKSRWLDKDLSSTSMLGMKPFIFVVVVCVESVGLLILSGAKNNETLLVRLAKVTLPGIFCIDMSLLVLMVFQRYGNFETSTTKFFSRASYAVYLLHPLIVTILTGILSLGYGKLSEGNLAFSPDKDHGVELVGESKEVVFIIYWILLLLLCNVVCWPLAYSLTRVPYLDKIL